MRLPLVLVAFLPIIGCQSMPTARPKPTANVSTFLMFQDGRAEQAMSLYAAVLPGSRVQRIERYGPGDPGREGSVKVASFDLNGHRLMFSDSYVKHAFTFTPSL